MCWELLKWTGGDRHSAIQEEKAEKALRMAEMEATKAGNIMEHEAEIYARPKREWFLTKTQKKASAQAAAQHEHSNALGQQDNKRTHTQSEKKKENKAERAGTAATAVQCCV